MTITSNMVALLMATPQVNGKGQILTPYRSKTLELIAKQLTQLIGSTGECHVPNLMTIHPEGTSGQMDEIKHFVTFLIIN